MTLDKQAHFFAGAALALVVALYADPLAGLAAGIHTDLRSRRPQRVAHSQ